MINQVRIQDLVRGGAAIFSAEIADGVQCHRASEVSIDRQGSRARLRALKALVF